jgi:hypothetical protein
LTNTGDRARVVVRCSGELEGELDRVVGLGGQGREGIVDFSRIHSLTSRKSSNGRPLISSCRFISKLHDAVPIQEYDLLILRPPGGGIGIEA